jgi:hypothetical protein
MVWAETRFSIWFLFSLSRIGQNGLSWWSGSVWVGLVWFGLQLCGHRLFQTMDRIPLLKKCDARAERSWGSRIITGQLLGLGPLPPPLASDSPAAAGQSFLRPLCWLSLLARYPTSKRHRCSPSPNCSHCCRFWASSAAGLSQLCDNPIWLASNAT